MGTALYQAGMTLLNKHKPLKLSGIARELTLSLTQLKENLKPYPGVWISVRRQVHKDHKKKPEAFYVVVMAPRGRLRALTGAINGF
jgi:hypothetical protein